MKKYVKVVLYSYPMLKTIGEEYQIHISNKALLSYRSQKSAEELVEYLAKEIICKNRLEYLKKILDGIMDKLDETEKALLDFRYFSTCKNRKKALNEKSGEMEKISAWSESTYFRRQTKLANKIEALLEGAGFSEEIFERDFAFIDVFQCVEKFLQRSGATIYKKERVVRE